MKNYIGLLIILSLPTLVFAGDPPATPVRLPASLHRDRYWTRANFLLVAADAAAKSTDMLFTMRNAGHCNFVEHDPLARPFVTHGRTLAGLSQAALFSGDLFLSYQLHKHGHARAAKAVLIFGATLSAAGAITSALDGNQIGRQN